MTDDCCRICGERSAVVLEEHHIIPKRYGGGDVGDNLVTLCANCHRAVESIYDSEVWNRVNLTSGWGADGPTTREHIWKEENLISKLEQFKIGVEEKHLKNRVEWDDYKTADYTECDDKRTAFMLGQYQAFDNLQRSLFTNDANFVLEEETLQDVDVKKGDPLEKREAIRDKYEGESNA